MRRGARRELRQRHLFSLYLSHLAEWNAPPWQYNEAPKIKIMEQY
jgi:hypothetical protein